MGSRNRVWGRGCFLCCPCVERSREEQGFGTLDLAADGTSRDIPVEADGQLGPPTVMLSAKDGYAACPGMRSSSARAPVPRATRQRPAASPATAPVRYRPTFRAERPSQA